MSDPQGQLSGLPIEESPLNQSSAGEDADSLSDTSQHFETRLENLKSSLETRDDQPAHATVANAPVPGEIKFEGTLRVNGYAAGFLSSLEGTLIIGKSGKLEADLIVATVIIDGFLRGNIHATESVVLGSHARVFGDIESPTLSIKPGAVFEGQCHFLPRPYLADGEDNVPARSGPPSFSIPSSADFQSAGEEAGEEEAELLAVAGGR